MEYRGGTVTSDLAPKLTLFEDRHYDLYQRVGNEVFAGLLREMRSNIRQFFPLEEVRQRETYLWFEGDELVGSIRMNHNREESCHEIERVMVAPQCQGKGYGTRLLAFAVAKLQHTHRVPIALTVAACNAKAIRMYERFGFVVVSERVEEWRLEGTDRA
jgi:ribosomal protein S18 acetylase RimI-like enzyme